jgi:hypothetical protein
VPYTDHFRLTDDLIAHLDVVFGALKDPFIESRYTGFLAVSAVTVYELAIKTIFSEFSERKHKVLGNFSNAHFEKLNGRIKIDALKGDHVKRYGDKYVTRFKNKLDKREKVFLKAHGASACASYGNVITWRHSFAHTGIIPTTATYLEVKTAYQHGKEIIHCLAESMRR